MKQKYCLECGKENIGRIDRKFCSDYCKTAYHNHKYYEENYEILRINKILKKNRSILKKMYSENSGRCSSRDLFQAGYNFDYFTSIEESRNKESSCIMICYDYQYSINKDGEVSVEKTPKDILA